MLTEIITSSILGQLFKETFVRKVKLVKDQRNMKGIRGVCRNGKYFKTSIMNNDGKRLYKSFKTEELATSWRREKELEFGYLTRAPGVLRPQ